MRVISGTAKGRHLAPPADRRVRPTTDRIKEALFSILTSFFGDLDRLSVLDLFAGTGSLGIEALSRGAAKAVFIDNNKVSAALVKENLRSTGLSGSAEVIQADVIQALAKLDNQNRKFDLVFADPPYGMGLADKFLDKISATTLLAEGALVVVESGAKENFPLEERCLRQIDRRVYGDTALTFFATTD
ncbi:putative rRNA methyltransferase YlbH [Geobacter sp. OR-1]|uniref:16S rRNA (guanine(966)-N(2))-methyltransferase RsmD n=1 Tax=Geobacter sp. OR-1 TaxID=1266765 RepID=UPI00054427BB|nr:16S rRNA (guanine(966)-N(2))-methyltransferase RsmD [Geobacter sp. OR-1]GAM11046.1 putative rRNA methyltransferase YlbH [Geobacter sp. OR-1]